MRTTAGQLALLFGAASLAAAVLVVAPTALTAGGETILTAAGNGARASAGEGGQATEAALDRPRSVAATRDGGYVWAEPFAHRVRLVSGHGIVTTVAGINNPGHSGDGGPAVAAELNFVQGAAQMTDGGYVLADAFNHRIRRVWPDGRITTVVGTGTADYFGDGGPAIAAQINNPRGVTALSDGGFLIPDTSNHRVRRVWPDGMISTVAGTGTPGLSGDGGQATAAMLSAPFGVSPTADGGFLIADIGNQRIRKVAPDGTITTVAGNGVLGFSGDGGPATAASLNQPHNVTALSDGGFLVADTANNRIRRVWPDGRITTIAGTGAAGHVGDGGAATRARLSSPKGVAVLPNGSILVADEQNNRIRFIGLPRKPVNVKRPSVSGSAVVGRTLRATPGDWRGYGVRLSYKWQRCGRSGRSCAAIRGADGPTYVVGIADTATRIRVQVTASTATLAAFAPSASTRQVRGTGSAVFPADPSSADGHVFRFEKASRDTPARVDTKRDIVVVARSGTPTGTLVSAGLLRFDTSGIPRDVRIKSVTLRIQVLYSASQDGLPLRIEPYPSGRWPIDPRDLGGRPGGPAVASIDIAALQGGQTALIRLSPQAVRARAVTGLRLFVPGGRTSGANGITFASFDHSELEPPALVVRYAGG